MDISFDPAKNLRNIEAHGMSLARASEFEWLSAFNMEDRRRDYGERRFKSVGFIEHRLHVVIHTPRGDRVHVISLRKANKREIRDYAINSKKAEVERGSGQSSLD